MRCALGWIAAGVAIRRVEPDADDDAENGKDERKELKEQHALIAYSASSLSAISSSLAIRAGNPHWLGSKNPHSS